MKEGLVWSLYLKMHQIALNGRFQNKIINYFLRLVNVSKSLSKNRVKLLDHDEGKNLLVSPRI